MKIKQDKLFTIANLISFSRIILCIPLILVLDKLSFGKAQDFVYAFILIVLIVLTDLFDGMVARYSKQITNFGKLIDPVADKISLMVVVIYLIFTYGLPFLIFFIILSIRDIFLIIIGIYLIVNKGEMFESNFFGKWFVGIFACTMASFLFQANFIVKWSFYIVSIILFFLSTYHYFMRYIKHFNYLDDE